MSNLYGTYIGNNRIFITPQWGGKLHAHADDLSVTTGLLLDGLFEVGLTNFIIKSISKGMNCVDVGANIGYFSVLLGYQVGEQGTVNSYEPNPNVYQTLVDNLTLNELKHNVVHHKKGVYSEDNTLHFNVSERFQGNSSLKSHSEQYRKDFKSDTYSQRIINVVSLDNENLGDYIHFLKIDVEGGEYHVFKGAENRLKEKSIDSIVFELNKSMLQEDTVPFYDLLKSHEGNYNFFLFNTDGTCVRTSVDEIYEHNYIDNILMKIS